MKICSNCKIEKTLIDFSKDKNRPDGLRCQCKECNKQYNIDNAEHYKQYHKQYNIKNKDKKKEYRIKYSEKNKQYLKQYYQDNLEKIKEYRIDNADKIKEYHKQYDKQYVINNAERLKEYRTEYYQTEHGKLIKRVLQQKRRILKLQNTPIGKHFTADDIKLKLKLQHSKCIYCKISIKGGYHIDHIMPLCKGGSNESSNIQLLCKDCNKSGGKGSKLPHEYAQEHGMLF